MQRLFGTGIIGVCWGVSWVFISITMVHPQEGKEALLQKQSQAEVAAAHDS